MSKYSTPKNYIYYEGSNIPINLLEIKDQALLEEKERDLLLAGYEYFHNNLSKDTVFDEAFYIKLHKLTFGPLFSFAGKYRESNITKGYSSFCQVKFLNQTSAKIFAELKNDNYLRDYQLKSKIELASKITYYLSELIALHPFYEFNGRVTRLFFDMIATYNGYEYIDYSNALFQEQGENLFILASIDCLVGNNNRMFNIIFDGLKKS